MRSWHFEFADEVLMVVLTCLVVNDGDIFSVAMSETQLVDELTDAICWKIDSSIEPNDLTLCAAKNENGQWLHLDEDDLAMLRNGDRIAVVDALMTKKSMPTVRSLSSASFGFLTDEAKQRGTIHVLVEVAADRWAQLRRFKKAKTSDESLYQSSDTTSATPRTAKKYAHSQINSTIGRDLVQDLNIAVEYVHVAANAGDNSNAPVPPFNWVSADGLSDGQLREEYYKYIHDNICGALASQKLCLYKGEADENVLSVRVPHHNVVLTGRPDLLILSDIVQTSPSALPFLPGAKMLIEVTRTIRTGSFYQGLSKLVALDLLTSDHVMALVTDLAKEWHFFWVSDKTETKSIVQGVFIQSPGEAFEVVKARLVDDQLPALDRPLKRRKLDTIIASMHPGDNNGVLASLQQYFDIASELGPDVEMARAVAHRLVGTLPSLSVYSDTNNSQAHDD